MAAKKKRSAARAKKVTSKKTKQLDADPKTHTFIYFCKNDTCGVNKRSKHIGHGDIVVLFAKGTDVTIDFIAASPFVSGDDPITLSAGVPQTEIVGSTDGTFRYSMVCTECHSSLHIPPEMIVP